jgi:2-polyprenyl-6-methoxyphenol hydroxylase-like FAD-dependent oxidoreductase
MASPGPIRTPVLIVGGGPVGLATAMAGHAADCVVAEPRATVSASRPRA